MRAHPIALLGASVSLALSGCTSSPTDTSVAQPSAGGSPAVVSVSWDRIQVPSGGVRLAKDLQRGGALRVKLIVDGKAEPNSQFPFTVRLKNVSSDWVPLNPCPPYRTSLVKVLESGMLNCSDAPEGIAPNGAVDFSMEVEAARYLRGLDDALLVWQLGSERNEGPSAATGVPVAETP